MRPPPNADRGEQGPHETSRRLARRPRPAPPDPLLHLGRRVVRRWRRYRRELMLLIRRHLGGRGRHGSRGTAAAALGRAGLGLPQERHGAGAQAVVHPERRGRQARPLHRRGHVAGSPGGDRPQSELLLLLLGIHEQKWKLYFSGGRNIISLETT